MMIFYVENDATVSLFENEKSKRPLTRKKIRNLINVATSNRIAALIDQSGKIQVYDRRYRKWHVIPQKFEGIRFIDIDNHILVLSGNGTSHKIYRLNLKD